MEKQNIKSNQDNFEEHNWGTHPARYQAIQQFSSLQWYQDRQNNTINTYKCTSNAVGGNNLG